MVKINKIYMRAFRNKYDLPDPVVSSSEEEEEEDSEYDSEREGVKRRRLNDDNDNNDYIDEADSEIKLKDKYPSIRRKNLKLELSLEQSYQEHVNDKLDSFITCDQSWANIRHDQPEDSDGEEVPSGSVSRRPTQDVRPSQLDFTRVFNLDRNQKTKNKTGYVQALQFHPKEPLAMVARNHIISLFKVDAKTNPEVDSLQFKDYPFDCVRFTPDGSTIVGGSKFLNYYITYDVRTRKLENHQGPQDDKIKNLRKFEISPDGKLMVSANHNNLYFSSFKSRQLLHRGHQNTQIRAIQFSPDGSLLFTHGEEGKVHVWDLRTHRIQHSFMDQGALTGNVISFTPDSQNIALGSNRGIVNVYETSHVLSTSCPQPVKSFTNLTHHITSTTFNCTGQILGMASCYTEDAVKLAHMGTRTVYQNFPRPGTDIGRCTTMAFSPGSGYLALGTNKGPVQLYRLKHYEGY